MLSWEVIRCRFNVMVLFIIRDALVVLVALKQAALVSKWCAVTSVAI